MTYLANVSRGLDLWQVMGTNKIIYDMRDIERKILKVQLLFAFASNLALPLIQVPFCMNLQQFDNNLLIM
jgi:hypothetical protein